MLLERNENDEGANRDTIEDLYAHNMLTDERNNNQILDTFNQNERATPIQDFYAGERIFITGGTGFLGKILIDKLLRSCPDISAIYLLIRSKKGKNVQSRVEDLFQDRVYDRLKKEVPKFRDKIFAISGDCSIEGLGLSEADKNLLINNVSIVFHVAATVRFDENLKLAMAINVQSTGDVLEMCKSMHNLKSVIHVSTAYANSHLSRIEECFYPHTMNYEDITALVSVLSANAVNELTPRIIGQWPNTYTFTKALAEALVKERSKGLPIGIFRPAIVVSTAREPVPGWIDNLYGPTGIVAGTASGLLRILPCDANGTANIVPVDLTVNALIASAWDVYTHTERRHKDMLIYNFVSSVEARLTWQDYAHANIKYADEYPLSNSMWYLSFTMTKSTVLYTIGILFLHLLPALLVDTARICVGHKPRLWRLYEKIHKLSKVLSHFCRNEWTFTNDNVQAMWLSLNPKDQSLFKFSMKNHDWSKYFTNYMKGIRIYIFNDDLSTLDASKTRLRRLYWLHQVVKTFVLLIGLWIAWCIISLSLGQFT